MFSPDSLMGDKDKEEGPVSQTGNTTAPSDDMCSNTMAMQTTLNNDGKISYLTTQALALVHTYIPCGFFS
jgi:hypothetical protein